MPRKLRGKKRFHFAGAHDIVWTMEKFELGLISITASAADIESYALYESGTQKSDITVLSHAAFSEPVDLFREIGGETQYLKRVAELSERENNTVVAGVMLNYGGIKKLSAAVAHKGELTDVTDSCSVSDPFTRSGTVKIYNTGKAKAAVLTGGDARVGFILKKIRGACNFAISLEPEYRPENEQRIKKLAKEFSLPVLYVSPARIFMTAAEEYRNTLN